MTLNVAGNREGTRGLYVFDLARIFLVPVFLRVGASRLWQTRGGR